mmetsp:Transcript_47720/g.112284  ORF Transcript_47720/g.112284 Transcript_47720/m.112284 type:complete len:138 (+) Transcript_47720:2-415(+)
MADLEARVRAEIDRLHVFFQEWFLGKLEDDAFSSFANAMDESFVIISPRGVATPMPALGDDLRKAKGAWPGGRIWIENGKVLRNEGGIIIATYEEWQQTTGDSKGRLSTCLLREEAGAPGGFRWLHVHETWLPEAPK